MHLESESNYPEFRPDHNKKIQHWIIQKGLTIGSYTYSKSKINRDLLEHNMKQNKYEKINFNMICTTGFGKKNKKNKQLC